MAIVDLISDQLNLNSEILVAYVKNSEKYYSTYKIPKKSGGERRILHPSPLLKTLQYWLNINVFSSLPVSDHAFGYRKGLSIKKNAEYHLMAKHLLHLDIKDFFESITREQLLKLFESNKTLLQTKGITEDDYPFILDACCYRNSITIGSVSSPVLSNCIMHQVDLEIRNRLPYGMRFSRYADDMVFSSQNYIKPSFVRTIENLLKRFGFTLNEQKTCFMSKKRREVTGLILDNGKISVGTKRKKEIKNMVYRKMVKKEGDSRVILGYLSFLKDIEPNYFNSIILKYSEYGNVMDILINDSQTADGKATLQDETETHDEILQDLQRAYEEAAPTLLDGE